MRITGHVSYLPTPKVDTQTYSATSKHASRGRAWSRQEDARLLAMWGKHTCREIALELGRNRNAVIGRAHRIGADTLPSPIRRAA